MNRYQILKQPESAVAQYARQTLNSEWNELAENTTMSQWMGIRNNPGSQVGVVPGNTLNFYGVSVTGNIIQPETMVQESPGAPWITHAQHVANQKSRNAIRMSAFLLG